MRVAHERHACGPAHRAGPEQGAVAVVVAIAAVALFGFAAYAVDLGNAWQARRALVTVTDAAALAAARDAGLGRDACAAAASIVARSVDTTMTSCRPAVTGRNGYVTVNARRDVGFAFAPVLGRAGTTIRSSTTAQVGPPARFHPVPLGVCVDATPELRAWLVDRTLNDAAVDGRVVTVPVPGPADGFGSTPDCGTDLATGPWGQLDFTGDRVSRAVQCTWWGPGGFDARGRGTEAATVAGTTREAGVGCGAEMHALFLGVDRFELPVYDRVVCVDTAAACAGTTSVRAHFVVKWLVGARFVEDPQVTLRPSGGRPFLRLRLVGAVRTGEVGGVSTEPGNLKAVRICAVDRRGTAFEAAPFPDPASACGVGERR